MRLPLPIADQPEACVNVWYCGVELLTSPLVVGIIASIGAVLLLVMDELQTAVEACRTERECVVAERDAFQQFQTRIRRVDPVTIDSPNASQTNMGDRSRAMDAPSNPGDATLKYVLSTYEQTVRSVPHYSIENEETLAENLAAELGEDIVTSLATNKVLIPAVQQAIVDRSQNAIDAREDLVDAITDEIDLLTHYQTELTTIETRQHNLREHLDTVQTRRGEAAFDIWCALQELETELDEIAKQRQADLRDPPIAEPPTESTSGEQLMFCEYLYAESDAPQYPVLSAIGDLGTAIRTDIEQIRTKFG
ncbi:DUF7260 family protein [Halorubrum xinjiangense]|uniref:DUF7260 family protein n=1 Tax=Halorubrum xinjiangense TaxID=261291 RepID=UPI003C6F9570